MELFARDYRQQRLNSKCFIKKTTMPPKNNYTKPSLIPSWADVAEEETLDNMADREGQRLLREDSTPFTTPKFVSHVPYAVHNTITHEAKTFMHKNAFDSLSPMPPLPPEPPRPGRAPSVSSAKSSVSPAMPASQSTTGESPGAAVVASSPHPPTPSPSTEASLPLAPSPPDVPPRTWFKIRI